MREELTIVYRPLNELIPCARNARTHSDEQVAQLVASIKEFGWTNPVLVDECGEIIAGHGRVMAAESLGMNTVPVIVLANLTDDQKRAYRLADNRLPMNAGWDVELLKLEITELLDADFDISLTGFNQDEIDELLTEVLSGTGNEDEPYTTKIDSPVYEPSGEQPAVSQLYDDTKTQELVSRIRSASLEPDIEKFLLSAAARHTVFNFSKIADYYAHSPAEIQALFEESALVIIDFQQAIEHGFVRMTQRMVEIMHGEEEEYA
ncbi:transcriptional regulator [Salmonella enterica subsp. enterica serovar Frintrop]|nr:transcriptional regulator [Salmonella enterica subsp. enterica serovar Frintrop]